MGQMFLFIILEVQKLIREKVHELVVLYFHE